MDTGHTLNRAQHEAASHIDGPLLILAGAGSGKTKVLTHRIANMVQQGGIPPFCILAITFTNKAASEMRSRVNAICREGESVWVSTFHSLCVRILRREIHNIGYAPSFTILDTEDSLRIVKKCLAELRLDDKLYPPKSVFASIGRFKDHLVTPEEAARDVRDTDFRLANIVEVYKMYSHKLRQNNSLDFDDLIARTVQIFAEYPEVLARYQERFRYIMVDEYQDTNAAQYELVRLLSLRHKNICVVGDDDQSIYGWRGADIRNILDFEKDFAGATSVKLEQNYRSTRNILNAANSVIGNNAQRTSKKLWTDAVEGAKIGFCQTQNDRDEAKIVADLITARLKEGGKYSDHAVLYRSNFLSRVVEEELVKAAIPHRIFGGTRFYDRKEIRDILSYLRLINNPRDSVSLARIINVPRRGIGDVTIQKLEEYAATNDKTLFDVLDDLDSVDLGRQTKKLREFKEMIAGLNVSAMNSEISELLEAVLKNTGYINELKLEATDEANARIENIDALVAKAVEFQQTATEPTLAAFLEELSLVSDIDNYDEGADAVTLMTLHSSKGLEFDSVYIVGCEEGQFPTYRATTSETPAELEEERRLAYVGITRARRRLTLTSAYRRWARGNEIYSRISRFVTEISQDNLENVNMDNKRIDNDAYDESNEQAKSQEDKAVERTGISRYAEINKVRNSIDISFGGKNYMQRRDRQDQTAKEVTTKFNTGDRVRLIKYGVGTVLDVKDAGADTELTIDFEGVGKKKILANLSKLKKV